MRRMKEKQTLKAEILLLAFIALTSIIFSSANVSAAATYIVKINPSSCFNSSDCSKIDATRTITVQSGQSKITNFIRYTGNVTVKNFTLYENIPKTFLSDSNYILVDHPGASIKIIERDPEYIFVYPEIRSGQQITMTYTIRKEVDTRVIDSAKTRIDGKLYTAEENETIAIIQICTPNERACNGSYLQECVPDGAAWSVIQICDYVCEDGSCRNPVGVPTEYNYVIATVISVATVIGLILIYKFV